MTRFTMDNTDGGFTRHDLSVLNAVHDAVTARAPDLAEKSVADAINNEWLERSTAHELLSRVITRLGLEG